MRRMRRESLLNEFFKPPVQSARYRVEKVIGEGAYGVVASAIDTHTNERVAVKRIKKVLHSDGMATRILRELKFLRLLNAHDNIVTVKDVLIPSERDAFDDVFVVMELLPTDLGRLLRSKTVLSEAHVKLLMYQLLCGVNYLHQSHVFHRDLNPANILVDTECQLRICDFGLARCKFQGQGQHRNMRRNDDILLWTDYVATRWYRAPELILAQTNTKYSTAIDIWSVGCIFAEMLAKGKPLFPGQNAHDQLLKILNVTGKPSENVIHRIGDRRLAQYLSTLPNMGPTDFSRLFPELRDPSAVRMLNGLLAFDPDQRITALDALQSPYFDDFRSHGYGATTAPLDERQFAFERARLTAREMRFEFLREIAEYHPESREEIIGGYNVGGEQGTEVVTMVSQAGTFGRDMKEMEMGMQARKVRTLTTNAFKQINPEDVPSMQMKEGMDYKNATIGHDELTRIEQQNPGQHASSFVTHAATLGSNGNQSEVRNRMEH